LLPALEAIRRDRISVSDEDVTPGIAALGAPVFDHHGDVVGALSISGVREAILGEKSAPWIRELIANGAVEVSRGLGFIEADATPGA
jgi:DNA-binding IclR family transcriptional regulator